MPEHQALRFAVLGDERDARGNAPACRRGARGTPSTRTSPRVVAVGTGNRAQDLGAARADQAGQPDDLARAHGKRYVVEVGVRRASRCTSKTDRRTAGTAGKLGKVRFELAARPSRGTISSRGKSRAAARSTTLPSRITAMRSAMRGSSSMRCEM